VKKYLHYYLRQVGYIFISVS